MISPSEATALIIAIGIVIRYAHPVIQDWRERMAMQAFPYVDAAEDSESGVREARPPQLGEYVPISQDDAAAMREELETCHLNERASHRHLVAAYTELALITEERDTLRKENEGLRIQLEMAERQIEDSRTTLQAREGENAA